MLFLLCQITLPRVCTFLPCTKPIKQWLHWVDWVPCAHGPITSESTSPFLVRFFHVHIFSVQIQAPAGKDATLKFSIWDLYMKQVGIFYIICIILKPILRPIFVWAYFLVIFTFCDFQLLSWYQWNIKIFSIYSIFMCRAVLESSINAHMCYFIVFLGPCGHVQPGPQWHHPAFWAIHHQLLGHRYTWEVIVNQKVLH